MMDAAARLFVGIELGDEARAALTAFRRELDRYAVGKLADPSLYHLTLCFLGQTAIDRIPQLCELLDEISFRPFKLSMDLPGTFQNSSILWIGIEEPCDALYALQSKLADMLTAAGFPLEAVAYSPHITLGRQMKQLGDLPEPPKGSFVVSHITLFESTKVDGRLAYVPLHRFHGS